MTDTIQTTTTPVHIKYVATREALLDALVASPDMFPAADRKRKQSPHGTCRRTPAYFACSLLADGRYRVTRWRWWNDEVGAARASAAKKAPQRKEGDRHRVISEADSHYSTEHGFADPGSYKESLLTHVWVCSSVLEDNLRGRIHRCGYRLSNKDIKAVLDRIGEVEGIIRSAVVHHPDDCKVMPTLPVNYLRLVLPAHKGDAQSQ